MKTKQKRQRPESAELLTNGPNGSKPTFEEVAKCAYGIWEKRGRTDGHDVADWLEAQTQLGAKHE